MLYSFLRYVAVGLLVTVVGCGAVATQTEPSSSVAAPSSCSPPRKQAPDESWSDPSPHRCGYITVNGVQLHYLDWGGTGDPLLFLHGLGTSSHIFDDLAPRLTDSFRVLALTRRGHAESEHPEGGYTIEQTSSDVLAFLNALGIRRVHLVAHSLGGAEAMLLGVEHPELLQRIVLLDGLPDWTEVDSIYGHGEPERPAPGDAFRSISTHREWLRQAFYGFWAPALEADFRYSGPNPTANAALRDNAFARVPEYGRLRVPTLAIVARPTLEMSFPWLERQGADPEEYGRAREYLERVYAPYQLRRAERFRQSAPGGQVLVLEGSHFIQNSNLDAVFGVIRAYLLRDR